MRDRRKTATFGSPKVLVLHEHHGTFYMDAATQDAFHRSVLRILKGRLSSTEMYFWEDEDRLEAERAIERSDGDHAWTLLRERNSFESERIDLEDIKTNYGVPEEKIS